MIDKVHSRDAEQILAELEVQQNILKQELQGYQRITTIDDALSEFLTTSEISRGLMMSVGAVIAVSALTFAALVAAQARDIRFSETGMVRARGATAAQEIALMTGETLLIAVISLVAGIAIAFAGVTIAGKLPILADLSRGEFLPASLSIQSVSAAVIASLIGLLALLLPSIRRNTSTASDLTDRLARPPTRNLVQRYYLDVVLLCIGVAALWQLSQEDLYISSSSSRRRIQQSSRFSHAGGDRGGRCDCVAQVFAVVAGRHCRSYRSFAIGTSPISCDSARALVARP